MTRNSKTKASRVGFLRNFFCTHVWRVPYEASIPLRYGDSIHILIQQIKKSTPGTKLFAVNRPQPNLRKRSHRALVKTLNDLGNVQSAADSLSVDASLLLSCRATAENGNCSHSKRRRVASKGRAHCQNVICFDFGECVSWIVHMVFQWNT